MSTCLQVYGQVTLGGSTRHGVSREFADGAQQRYLCLAKWRKMPNEGVLLLVRVVPDLVIFFASP